MKKHICTDFWTSYRQHKHMFSGNRWTDTRTDTNYGDRWRDSYWLMDNPHMDKDRYTDEEVKRCK